MIKISNNITWLKPLSNAPWTHTQVLRSATENGTYSQISLVAISTSNYYDSEGTSTSWYKIRFYDSVNLIYSEYSNPLQGTIFSREMLDRTVTAVTVLGTLGAIGPDSCGNYSIFGMAISQQVAEKAVEQSYNYAEALIGETKMTDSAYAYRVEGFVSDFSALRILAILCGISIPSHFNFSAGGLNVQKPVVGQMKQTIDMYMYSCKRWQKMLLTRGIMNKQTDLSMYPLNEYSPALSGNVYITYDGQA